MKKLLILTLILISSCQEKLVKNDAPLSGIIDQENEKTIIVEKLAQGYVDGKFEVAEAYFTEDGIHRVNDAEYSTEEIIAGYNFHSVLFDNIKHNDPWVTTMIYNNGQVFTNQWARWTRRLVTKCKSFFRNGGRRNCQRELWLDRGKA